MSKRSMPFEEVTLLPMLRENEELCLEYLKECLEDEDSTLFLHALRQVAQAKGITMKELSEATGLGRESLYKTLTKGANPKWSGLISITKALGLKLTIQSA